MPAEISQQFRSDLRNFFAWSDKQTYELFDNICLMMEGKIIYHGPRVEVVPYLNSLG